MTILKNFKKFKLFIAPIALLLVLGACKDDDIRIVTYDFSDAFDNVELGTVNTPTNPPLEIENLESPTVTTESTESTNLITDITDGATDATTDAVIADVESIVNTYFDATDIATASALDAAGIDAILAASLSADQTQLAQEVLNLSGSGIDISAYLPTVEYNLGGSGKSGLTLPDIQGVSADDFIGYPGDATCYVTAENQYQQTIAPAVAQRDAAIAAVTAEYNSLLAEVDTRKTERIQQINADYDATIEALDNGAAALIAAAANLTDANQQAAILQLAYTYLVVGKYLMDVYKAEALARVDQLAAEETQAIEDQYNNNLDQIEADFQASIAQAKDVRNAAFEACHNQGG
jgi:hypothetical protein